jgi:regulator of replication initiation timing
MIFGKSGLNAVKKSMDSLEQRLETIRREMQQHLETAHRLQVEEYLRKNLFNHPKYESPKRLNRFEWSTFSQFGEDGIIAEIFKRIGTTNRYFIEFGVENGEESNTTNLLYQGWKGLWIEGNKDHVEKVNQTLKKSIEENRLKIINAFITAENIEQLFDQGGAEKEPDLLSIDIDRNDYHIWNAINTYKPRVIVIEYNAIYRPGHSFIVPYDPKATWDGSSHFGASLQSFYELGLKKGYKLVACTHSGVNAFFVREDLVRDHFEDPFTPEVHYEPARYYLYKKDGHYRKLVDL